MNPFTYRAGILHAEDVPLPRIAEHYGTPCYVYSRAALLARLEEFRRALAGREALLCYAVKANSNLAVLNLFARAGTGFDIVSGGELARVLAAGGDPGRVVFSGVGKSAAEMRQALQAGILCFNVESAGELERLAEVAAGLGLRAPVSLRVNPDVDPQTHPYIATGLKNSKFGIPYTEALSLYRRARTLPALDIRGIACHIGSQLLDPAPAAAAAARLLELADALAAEGIMLSHIDLGGGMGIRYRDEAAPQPEDYLAPLLALLAGRPQRLLIEPGRALVGNAGLLLTRIAYLKHGRERNFAVVDAAMNDLLRPALYQAWHEILPVVPSAVAAEAEYEIVGPVCESGDFLGHARRLALAPGELLAVMSAGAYGMTMSSNYNSRPRAAEVMVDGERIHLVRERERPEQLFAGEHVLP